MKDAKLEYATLTGRVLTKSGYIRKSTDAQVNFLRTGSGVGAWGHVSANTPKNRYGKVGFDKKRVIETAMTH